MQLINTHAEQYDLSFENKVSFYEKNDFDSIIESNPVNNSWKWAGGGYISTTEEMAKFTWNILNSDFLRPDVLNLMLSPQELMDGNKTSYGIGWAIRKKNNQKFLGHTGGSVGGTTFVFSSESGHIVSLMANLSNASFEIYRSKFLEFLIIEIMNIKHFIFLFISYAIISCNIDEKKYRFAVIQYFHETCTFCPGGDTDINDWTRNVPYVEGKNVLESSSYSKGFVNQASLFKDVEIIGINSPDQVFGGSSRSWNTKESFEHFMKIILDDLKSKLPVDGVQLSLHGAMAVRVLQDQKLRLQRE